MKITSFVIGPRKAGMNVRAFPQIGVVHLGTAQSLRVFFRKQAWHGTHVIKVFLRDPLKSHNRKAVFFAAYTLLSLLAVAAAWCGHLRDTAPGAPSAGCRSVMLATDGALCQTGSFQPEIF